MALLYWEVVPVQVPSGRTSALGQTGLISSFPFCLTRAAVEQAALEAINTRKSAPASALQAGEIAMHPHPHCALSSRRAFAWQPELSLAGDML